MYAKPVISGEADTVDVDLCADDLLLLLGCDGVFDAMTADDLLDAVHRFVLNNESSGTLPLSPLSTLP